MAREIRVTARYGLGRNAYELSSADLPDFAVSLLTEDDMDEMDVHEAVKRIVAPRVPFREHSEALLRVAHVINGRFAFATRSNMIVVRSPV